MVKVENLCQVWGCGLRIRATHFLCRDHYNMNEDGSLDQCETCGFYSHSDIEQCPNCASDDLTELHVYILKIRDANGRVDFYVGQTNDLLVRLTEHRDGVTKTTAGKDPQLVWFMPVLGREEALYFEKELKVLVRKNPRAVRQMVASFQALTRELSDL